MQWYWYSERRTICHVQVGKHFADTALCARHFLHQGLSDGETMKTRTGRPRGLRRLARALGLDRNPLRRATDRAEAWIRVGLLAVFLIAGPMAALGAGHWAYHAGITAARVPATPAHSVLPAALLSQPVTYRLSRTFLIAPVGGIRGRCCCAAAPATARPTTAIAGRSLLRAIRRWDV